MIFIVRSARLKSAEAFDFYRPALRVHKSAARVFKLKAVCCDKDRHEQVVNSHIVRSLKDL